MNLLKWNSPIKISFIEKKSSKVKSYLYLKFN